MTEVVKPLRERLEEMGDRMGRHNYEIGHYWNVVDECAQEIDRLKAEIAEAEKRGVAFGFKNGQMKMRERSALAAKSYQAVEAIRELPIEGVLAY